MKSGSLELASDYLLSPMEGVSDVGFRRLCYANGAALTWTEMIRARGIVKRNKSTLDLVDTFDSATLTGVQLLVTSADELRAAASVIAELGATTHPHWRNIVSIDLNFGCPSPDVIKIGAGPALLKRRAKLRAIFEALSQVKQTLPHVKSVSAKIRLGLNQREQEHKVYVPVVEMANDTLDHLVVHARHAQQRSRDRPTWSAIGEAKVHAKIPIVGNGDVFSAADAARMRSETGCDAFMIARAAIRDPWVFRGTPATPAEIERARVEYLEMADRFRTKEKYRAFHVESFARLASAGEMIIPRNAHMT